MGELKESAMSLMVVVCLISYILIISLVERTQLFFRAVGPAKRGVGA